MRDGIGCFLRIPKLLNTDNLVSIERTETKRSFYFCAVQAYYDMHSVV